MKRSWAIILILLLAIGVFTGCGPSPEKLQKGFIAILEKPASDETIQEAKDYLDKYLPKMDEKNASEMVVHLEHYILGVNQDGISYDEWAKHYDKYISESVKELYQIKSKEQQNPIASDAALKVGWSELVQRAYDMELYIQKNKDEPLIKKDADWMYGYYMNAVAMGRNNTPIFDYKTHAFSQEARSVYTAFISKHPDSTTAWALSEYFTYLEGIQYTMDYDNPESSKVFFNTCDWLVSESGKRVFQ
jgi:hypothetical protein